MTKSEGKNTNGGGTKVKQCGSDQMFKASHRDKDDHERLPTATLSTSSCESTRSEPTRRTRRRSLIPVSSSSDSKLRGKHFRDGRASSSASNGKSSAPERRRKNKRPRTKSSMSLTPRDDRRNRDGRRRSDENDPVALKRKVCRADQDPSWRTKDSSKTSPGERENCTVKNGHGSDKSLDRGTIAKQRLPTNDPRQKSKSAINDKNPEKQTGRKPDGDPFDFASEIFRENSNGSERDESLKSTQAQLTKKEDKRTLRMLQLSDERRKKEYLAYQPPHVRNLYSYGIDNKGKREPKKTALSKKEEDVMFRKRAVYMMHLEDQERRKREMVINRKKAENEMLQHSTESLHHQPSTSQQKGTEQIHMEEHDVAIQRSACENGKVQGLTDNDEKERCAYQSNDSSNSGSIQSVIKKNGMSSTGSAEIPEMGYKGFSEQTHSSPYRASTPNELELKSWSDPEEVDTLHSLKSEQRSGPTRENGPPEELPQTMSDDKTTCDALVEKCHAGSTVSHSVEGKLGVSEQEKFEIGNLREGCPPPELLPTDAQSKGKTVSNVAEQQNTSETDGNRTATIQNDESAHGRHNKLPHVFLSHPCGSNSKTIPAAKKMNVIRIPTEMTSSDACSSNIKQTCSDTYGGKGLEKDDVNDTQLPRKEKDDGKPAEKPMPQLSKTAVFFPPNEPVENLTRSHSPIIRSKNDRKLSESDSSSTTSQTVKSLRRIQMKMPGSRLAPASSIIRGSMQKASAPPVILPASSLPNSAPPLQAGNFYLQRVPNVFVQNVTPMQPAAPGGAGSQTVVGSIPRSIQVSASGGMSHNNLHNRPCYVTAGKSTGQDPAPIPLHMPRTYIHGQNYETDMSPGFPKYQTLPVPPHMNMRSSVCTSNAAMNSQEHIPFQTLTGPNTVPSQGFMGYINVPVVKDDKGRIVVILPNDKTILETKNTSSHGQHLVMIGDKTQPIISENKSSAANHHSRQANPKISPSKRGASLKPFMTSTPKTTHDVLPHRIKKSDASLPNRSLDMPSQNATCSTEGRSYSWNQDRTSHEGQSRRNANETVVLNKGDMVAELANKKCNTQTSECAKSITGYSRSGNDSDTAKKESPCDANKSSNESKDAAAKKLMEQVCELRLKQRAITAKLKELRSVRALIAMDGRMGEEESNRMTERLKQVEDLFFKRLITCSVELTRHLKDPAVEGKSDVTGTAEPVQKPTSGTKEKHALPELNRKQDDGCEMPFGSNESLRSSIKSMSEKEEVPILVKKQNVNKCLSGASSRNKSSNSDKHCTSETDDHITRKNGNNANFAPVKNRSSSSVSNAADSDVSSDSSKIERFKPLATEHENHKIVLRLQRVRVPSINLQLEADGRSNETTSQSAEKQAVNNAEMKPSSKECHKTDQQLPLQKLKISGKAGQGHADQTPKTLEKEIGDKTGYPSDQPSSVRRKDSSSEKLEEKTQKSEFVGKAASSQVPCVVYSKTADAKRKETDSMLATVKDKCTLFTGPSKKQTEAEEKREREIVKQAWTRVFNPRFPDNNKSVKDRMEDDPAEKTVTESSRSQMTTQSKNSSRSKNAKTVTHFDGNPVIRGNLTSIGNINASRAVGSSSETRFQWLLKQLQKKRTGAPPSKDKRGRHTPPEEPEAKEYITVVSRAVQTGVKPPTSMTTKEGSKQNQEVSNDDEQEIAGNADCISTSACTKKKRGRDSTGSTTKPLEKLPRTSSPTDTGLEGKPDINAEIQELVALREEVISRQSSSSEETIEYNDTMVSVEEMTRRVKISKSDKKKLKSIGTMTMLSSTLSKEKAPKTSTTKKAPVLRFATKTRGHIGYAWCTKKISGQKKGSKTGKKAKKSPRKMRKNKDVHVVASDESTSRDLRHDQAFDASTKEQVRGPKRRNTLASLSARLWDECYWSTLNDPGKNQTATAMKHLPNNNSPPTTRKTGLESKMLQQWGDLLRYSGNREDVESVPVTVEDIENLNVSAAVVNSMKLLLDGYEMAKQTTNSSEENSNFSDSPTERATNDDNSAVVRFGIDEGAQTPWTMRSEDEAAEVRVTSNSSRTDTGDLPSDSRSDVSSQFSFETLTSQGSDPTSDTRRSDASYSTTLSPPLLEARPVGEIHVESTALRRWRTEMDLGPSHVGRNGVPINDPRNDRVNRNNCHQEGDSARAEVARSNLAVRDITPWQINGAGDLQEARSTSTTNVPGRNRRRQNRVISWPNIPEQYDSDDEIPLARLIERERLKKLVRNDQEFLGVHPTVEPCIATTPPEQTDSNSIQEDSTEPQCGTPGKTTPNDSDVSLPGPFFLEYAIEEVGPTQNDHSNDPQAVGLGTNDKSVHEGSEKNVDKVASNSTTVSASSQSIAAVDHGGKPPTQKRTGKFLYGESKKGKSLVRKPSYLRATASNCGSTTESSSTTSTSQTRMQEDVAGKRYVAQCCMYSDDDDVDETSGHVFYRDAGSSDVFRRVRDEIDQ